VLYKPSERATGHRVTGALEAATSVMTWSSQRISGQSDWGTVPIIRRLEMRNASTTASIAMVRFLRESCAAFQLLGCKAGVGIPKTLSLPGRAFSRGPG